MLLFVLSQILHFFLETVIVILQSLELFSELFIAPSALSFILSALQTPISILKLRGINCRLSCINRISGLLVILKKAFVGACLCLGVSDVLVEVHFELFVQFFNLLYEFMFHRFKLFDILIFCLFTKTVMSVLHVFK